MLDKMSQRIPVLLVALPSHTPLPGEREKVIDRRARTPRVVLAVASHDSLMRRSNRNFNISPTPPPGKPRAFELLKIGSFKFPPPRAKMGVQMPYPIVGFCMSNASRMEQSSSVPAVCNKDCVYSRYAETSTQDGKLF